MEHLSFDESRIIDHWQKYLNSCIPSCVEMILKLLRKVDIDFYDLQNDWGEKSDGSFHDFDRFSYDNVIFSHEFSSEIRGPSFPLNKLFGRIDELLLEGEFICVSLSNTNRFHMYIIFEKIYDEYRAFSKISNSNQTIYYSYVRKNIIALGGTDILTYKELSNT
jgi:hypothetical protein